MTAESYLTVDDLAAYLKVNRVTVCRMAGDGQIPAVRAGRQWRFRKSAIDAWLKTPEVSAAPRTLASESA